MTLTKRLSRPGPALAALAVSAVATLAVLVVGQGEAARGVHVLSALDGAANGFRSRSLPVLEWLWQRPVTLALAGTVAMALVAILALVARRARAAPVALLAVTVSLAAWGQAFLALGRSAHGWALYGAAVLGAIVLGAWRPMRELSPWPPAAEPSGGRPSRRWVEAGALASVMLLALVTRAWALNELPQAYDEEMISVHLESRTGYGLAQYISGEFVGTSNGLMSPLTDRVVLATLGTSIFSMRVSALLWGLLAVPLLWFLIRRMLGGVLPALFGTILFVCAPEQLFWSRSEVSIYAPVATLGLLFAHAVLWMTERYSLPAIATVALLTPFCRLFYTACHVLVALPLLVAIHGALSAKGLRKRALAAIPALVVGMLLWVLSVSAVIAAVRGTWAFVNPGRVRGESALAAGMPPGATPLRIATLQAQRFFANAEIVVRGFAEHARITSHWYERFYLSGEHRTSISMGLAILGALGAGFLLGQPRDARTALLLFWAGLGLLPGCLSDEPEARRISVVFVPLLLFGTLFAVHAVRLIWARGGRAAGVLATGLSGVALAAVAGSSLASHFLLPIGPIPRDVEMRAARPTFQRSDVVLTGIFYRPATSIAFGSLDRLLAPSGPCYQYVERRGVTAAALVPACDFSDEVFQMVLPGAAIEERRRTRVAPRRIGYLFFEEPASAPSVALLRRLYPRAPVSAATAPYGQTLISVEVDAAEQKRLTVPEDTGDQLRGGLLVREDGWYRAEIGGCPGARLAIGADSWDGAIDRPLLAGVVPFRASGVSGCARPLTVTFVHGGSALRVAPLVVAPAVAEAAEALAPRVLPFPGFDKPEKLLELGFTPNDFGVDRSGRIYLLALREAGWELKTFTPDAAPETRVVASLPRDPSTGTVVVFAEGGCALFCLNTVELYDARLRLRGHWVLPEGVAGSDMARLPDGRFVVVTNRMALEVFTPDGRPDGSFNLYGPDGRRFVLPAGIAVSPAGRIAVVEMSGQVVLFGPPPAGKGSFSPPWLRTLRLDLGAVPHSEELRGIAFEGEDKIFLPYEPSQTPLLFDLEGTRFMAGSPERDLAGLGLRTVYRVAGPGKELFVLLKGDGTISRVQRGATP